MSDKKEFAPNEIQPLPEKNVQKKEEQFARVSQNHTAQNTNSRRMASIRETEETTWQGMQKKQNPSLPHSTFENKNIFATLASQVILLSKKVDFLEKKILSPTPLRVNFPMPAQNTSSPDATQSSAPMHVDVSFLDNETEKIDIVPFQKEGLFNNDPPTPHLASDIPEKATVHLSPSKPQNPQPQTPAESPETHAFSLLQKLLAMNDGLNIGILTNMLQQGFNQGFIEKNNDAVTHTLDKIYQMAKNFFVSENALASSVEIQANHLPPALQNEQGFDHVLALAAASVLSGTSPIEAGQEKQIFSSEAQKLGFISQKDSAMPSDEGTWPPISQAAYIGNTIQNNQKAIEVLKELREPRNGDRAEPLQKLRDILAKEIPNIDALLGEDEKNNAYLAYLITLQEVKNAKKASIQTKKNTPAIDGLIDKNYQNQQKIVQKENSTAAQATKNDIQNESTLLQHPTTNSKNKPHIPKKIEQNSAATPPQTSTSSQPPPDLDSILAQLTGFLEEATINTTTPSPILDLLQNLSQINQTAPLASPSPCGNQLNQPTSLFQQSTPHTTTNATTPPPAIDTIVDNLNTQLASSMEDAARHIAETIASNCYDIEELWNEIWQRTNREILKESLRY